MDRLVLLVEDQEGTFTFGLAASARTEATAPGTTCIKFSDGTAPTKTEIHGNRIIENLLAGFSTSRRNVDTVWLFLDCIWRAL